MTPCANPFTPTYGTVPCSLAGRDRLISDVLEGLRNQLGDPNRTTLFIGTGKTVLLATIARAMNVSAAYASNTGKPLIERGIIQRVRRGYVTFEIPLLRAWLRQGTDF